MVIAEIGANHDGSMEKARRMIDQVAAAGAALVKFQLLSAQELVSDPDRMVKLGSPEKPYECPVGELFDKLAFSKAQMGELFDYAKSKSLVPFATPFSEEGVETLRQLQAPLVKIAASDVGNLPLLSKAASLGVPVILSLGKCTLAEADEAIHCLLEAGCEDLAILHCIAAYPSPMEQMNLRIIPVLKELYPDCVVGFSDHSFGLTAPITAVALGARLVEKHVTESKDDPGPDHWYSLEMSQLANLVKSLKDAQVALGSAQKRVFDCEAGGREKAVSSLFAARELPFGAVLRREDIKISRPGTGLAPKYLEALIGMKLEQKLSVSEPLSWDHFKPAAK
jgi:sialic acid synthase SpsE